MIAHVLIDRHVMLNFQNIFGNPPSTFLLPEKIAWPPPPRRRLPNPLPAKRDLFIDKNETQGILKNNITDLLDFAIVGFPKCGTTTMGRTLAQLNHGFGASAGDNCVRETADLVHRAYDQWGWANMTSATYEKPLRGFKCPQFLERSSSSIIHYFPQTKLIIGVRHPVRWFESFYNFIVQTNGRIPGPYEKTNACVEGEECSDTGCPNGHLFCTQRARFHLQLAAMMKTPMGKDELELLPTINITLLKQVVPNPVLLYETSQMSNENIDERQKFWDGIGSYLGYSEPMPEQINSIPGSTPNKRPGKQIWLDTMKIDICNAIWDKLRAILMDHAREASKWVLEYLLKAETNVYVSNEKQFIRLIEAWGDDPCGRLSRGDNGTWAVNGTVPTAVVERVEDSVTRQMTWTITEGIVLSEDGTVMKTGCAISLSERGINGTWSCPKVS